MKSIHVVLTLFGALTVLAVGSCAGLGFVNYWFREAAPAQEVEVALELPGNVAAGKTFPLVVTVRNRAATPQTLRSIELAKSLLEGVEIVEIEPAARGASRFGEFRTYDFQRPIPPGETVAVRFDCQALDPGIYQGDVDITINTRYSFVTRVGRIRVRDDAEPERSE